MNTRTPRLIVSAVVLAMAAAGYYRFSHAQAVPALPVAVAGSTAAFAPSGLPDMAGIAARFGPAVVNITVSGTRKLSTGDGDAADEDPDRASGSPDDDAMQDFLRRFQQRFGGLPPQIEMPVQGAGLATMLMNLVALVEFVRLRRAIPSSMTLTLPSRLKS